ncbi:hypothetical protein HDF16_001600 [Granulicella aggregans]|uniref:Uncharacterized protein n=1 Tax=Granulicella aggregans TaxID=474949 RepID=A0A7W8E491_9BACT|nr:hypothetical protein [Granulicella aggregans]
MNRQTLADYGVRLESQENDVFALSCVRCVPTWRRIYRTRHDRNLPVFDRVCDAAKEHLRAYHDETVTPYTIARLVADAAGV